MILSAVSGNNFEIQNLSDAQDTQLLAKALKSFKEGKTEFELGEGGTTIRFFIAFVAAMGRDVELNVHPDFLKRPMKEYSEVLHKLGVTLSISASKIKVSGKIRPGRVEVDCSKSTQFATALELVSEYTGIEVIPKKLDASMAYWKMTKALKEQVRKEASFEVPVDFSSLSYFISWGALKQKVLIENVSSIDSFQADSVLLNILKDLGVQWELDENGLVVYPTYKFNSVSIDLSQCLDLGPTLAFLLSYTAQKHTLTNLKNLKFKESNRLNGVLKLLNDFEIQHSYDSENDQLDIQGKSPDAIVRDIVVERDHRMVMAASLYLKINGGGKVAPVEAVDKSFPSFFEYFN